MPSQGTTSALTSLLPSLPATNKPFPPTLIAQSESLITLSRQRALHLKPEEEIARTHACCEIACKRLRAQLRLPAIKHGAGAPCKPTVYKKLITYLEGVLGQTTVGPLTPSGRKRDAEGTIRESGGSVRRDPSSQRRSASGNETPSKSQRIDQSTPRGFAGTIKATGLKARNSSTEHVDNAPSYVMPAIRKLCKKFGTTMMAPHVYTGACVILEKSTLWPPDEDEYAQDETEDETKEDILFLVVAIYLLVLTRMQKGKMTAKVYNEVSEGSMEVLELDDARKLKVDGWINTMKEEQWYDGEDWWQSVPADVFASGASFTLLTDPDISMENNEGDEDGFVNRRRARHQKLLIEEEDPAGVLLPGLGTMLHDGINWASDDRKADFEDWRDAVLLRLSAMNRPAKRGQTTTAVAA